MPTPRLSLAEAERFVQAVNDALRKGYRPPGQTGLGPGAIAAACQSLGLARQTGDSRLGIIKRAFNIEPDWSLADRHPEEINIEDAPPPPKRQPIQDAPRADIEDILRRGPVTLEQVASALRCSRGEALDAIDGVISSGVNVVQHGDHFSIQKTLAPAFTAGPSQEYVSRDDNTFVFGLVSDNHLGSKYERLDVLNELYDLFSQEGVDRVFNCGNWIDGVATFNAHDLNVYGMEPQLAYLARHYPRRDGIVTYAVAGEDHEGWFSRREGVDIGRRAEQTMREAGRSDWVNLGFMEAHVRLKNANTGSEKILAVVHPGGGTAYALSYSVQKIIEALEGGEKPAVALYGHYHKLWAGNIRNVWVCMAGCTQDQTVFTRNKIKQEVHVGGAIIRLTQDPESGTIYRFQPELIRYFAKGHPDNRWSKSGPTNAVNRAVM